MTPRFTVCESCGAVIPRDDARRVDGEAYCETCYDEKFVTCNSCGNVTPRDDSTRVDGEDYCETCYDEIFVVCEVLRGNRRAR